MSAYGGCFAWHGCAAASDGCDCAGMGDNCINGCWSGAWGEDGIDVASGMAGLVRVGVKLAVQGLACAGEAGSPCNVPDGVTDSVVSEVLVAAGQVLAGHGMGGIISMDDFTAGAESWRGGGCEAFNT